MRTDLMTRGEIDRAAYNLSMIEKNCSRPIPRGLLDASDYSDRMLTNGEAFNIAMNIEAMTKSSRSSSRPYYYEDEYSSEIFDHPFIAGIYALAILGVFVGLGIFALVTLLS